MSHIQIPIDLNAPDGYETFLRCKQLPRYQIIGNVVYTDELSHAIVFGSKRKKHLKSSSPYLFDYQRFIVDRALDRRDYAAYLDCGLGKTAIEAEFANRIADKFGRVLWLCPLSVMEDIQCFSQKFYGYRMSNLRNEEWKTDVAILNWESLKDLSQYDFGAIILDESSILKHDTGVIRQWLIQLSARCKYRLACSATPSPNEHAEYASQAVFLGVFKSAKEFYSKYFRKDGNEYILKPHAVERFYEELKLWACYIHKPSLLGFSGEAEMNHEPNYIEHYSTVSEKYRPSSLFTTSVSLAESRGIFGALRGDVNEARFFDCLNWLDGKSALIWCSQNKEQDAFSSALEDSMVVDGKTPIEKRVEIVNAFRRGELQYLISKPKVLGFGVNIPECNFMLYSGYNWSFESFYQAVRRAHRFGRKGDLQVYIPITDPETPIWNDNRAKQNRFEIDVKELQERFVND